MADKPSGRAFRPRPYEPEDPLEPVAVAVSGDEDSLAEMGRCFVEEFVRMGWRRQALLALFRDPFYQGPHLVCRKLGEEWVRERIEEALGARRSARVATGVRTG